MAKASTYLYFALAIIVGTGILYLIACSIWFWWDLGYNWQIPN